ncbi:RluA family pseudouridine synthase [Curvibacter microcysteis]|uniref:RluA family pseudouridine synthase n=1 Tax=Curvibacter microcysteis TaxID=3026419 RepID=UPI0030816537
MVTFQLRGADGRPLPAAPAVPQAKAQGPDVTPRPALTGRAARRERAAQAAAARPEPMPVTAPGQLWLCGPALPAPRTLHSPTGPLLCLYEDDSVLAFDKPAGMHSVPGKGEDKQDCLSARAQALFPEARVVHRLDLDTSGVIVMARGAEAQRRLNRSFELRQVDKRYVAVVQGCLSAPDGPWGLIDLPIALDWERRPLHTVDAATGRPSQTHWHLLDVDPAQDRSRVLLEPFTGRSHQLRVHLQALGHPMLGDRLYGGPIAMPRSPRLLLHATQILLPHPVHGQPLFIESPVPF